jgi:hypothetical protein
VQIGIEPKGKTSARAQPHSRRPPVARCVPQPLRAAARAMITAVSVDKPDAAGGPREARGGQGKGTEATGVNGASVKLAPSRGRWGGGKGTEINSGQSKKARLAVILPPLPPACSLHAHSHLTHTPVLTHTCTYTRLVTSRNPVKRKGDRARQWMMKCGRSRRITTRQYTVGMAPAQGGPVVAAPKSGNNHQL